jgi:methyl-accepting chemotaxis protein
MGFLFDLRGRPRYKGALAAKGEKWTRVDLFASTQNPGITASIPVNNKNLAIEGVCGFDIDLSTSSKFLECIKYLLTLAITRPLNSLQQGIRRVSSGDLDYHVDPSGVSLIAISPSSASMAARR